MSSASRDWIEGSESGRWRSEPRAFVVEAWETAVEEKDCSNGFGSRSKFERRGRRVIEG